MTTEQMLKNLILRRYHSIREFTIEVGIPYTTVDSIFRRGIGNSSVSNIIKICKALRISADALADGKIAPAEPRTIRPINDRIEIKEIIADTKELLIHGGEITLDGNPIGKHGVESFLDAMDVGVEMARRRK